MINFDTIYFNTIQYNILLPIYCIGGGEYHNVLYWCLRIVQYNNNSILPSPGIKQHKQCFMVVVFIVVILYHLIHNQ